MERDHISQKEIDNDSVAINRSISISADAFQKNLIEYFDDSERSMSEIKSQKKQAAAFLHLSTILFAVIGGLFPLLYSAGFFSMTPQTGMYGYIGIFLSAACIIIDKLFNISNGWVRYTETEMLISHLSYQMKLDLALLHESCKREKDSNDIDRKRLLIMEGYLKKFRAITGKISNTNLQITESDLPQEDSDVNQLCISNQAQNISHEDGN